MAKLFADEQFPFLASEHLQILGHDLLTLQDAGIANQRFPDDKVLSFATKQARAVLTLNRRDFIRLHNLNPNHAGIIVCTDDADKMQLAERIHTAIQAEQSLHCKLLRVVRPSKG